jgi:hypothetical protein
MIAAAWLLLALAMVAAPIPRAMALIIGGEGNSPVADPGWPKGAAAIFNTPARIARWEGPPFGGGQWHAECRGDAKAFNTVLAAFAKLDVKHKKVVVHDGVGVSFWLNSNREPAKQAAAKMDWVFMVWKAANWEHLQNMPADLKPVDQHGIEHGPPAQIDVYTGGNIRWPEVTMPAGLEVVDERLEAHGFTTADGIVLEGKVVDLATKRPVRARVQLQRVEPQEKGGYRYRIVREATAESGGRWVLKRAPAGWYRIVVDAEGFVGSVAGYAQPDDQPRWFSFDSELARPATVSGRISDDAGQPLSGVEVRLSDVVSSSGARYESPDEYSFKTGPDGRFRTDRVPVGRATVWLHKSGYCRPGLGQPITIPAKDVELRMMKSARLRVHVDFHGRDRPEGYIVEVEPERGAAVGMWGGSGNIDAQNQISFDNIPPGRYVVRGRPNPSSATEQSTGITIDLKGGKYSAITLSAK